MDTVGEAGGGVVEEVEGAHNEQILNDFGLVYVQAVCEIAFIDEPLPEERSVSPTSPLSLHPYLPCTTEIYAIWPRTYRGSMGPGQDIRHFAVFRWTTERTEAWSEEKGSPVAT